MSTDLVGTWNNVSAQNDAAPWLNIKDGENVVKIKEAAFEDGTNGPFIQMKLYYPEHNTSEDTRIYLTGNEVGVKIAKKNLAILNPKLAEHFDTDDDLLTAIKKTATDSVGGTLKLTRKTNTGKEGKQYRNYYFDSFKADEIPF